MSKFNNLEITSKGRDIVELYSSLSISNIWPSFFCKNLQTSGQFLSILVENGKPAARQNSKILVSKFEYLHIDFK